MMPPDNPDPTPDREEILRVSRLLQPFWDRLGAMQAGHDWMTDANILAALFEVPDSVLVRMLLDDRRDLAAARRVIEALGVGASSRRRHCFT